MACFLQQQGFLHLRHDAVAGCNSSSVYSTYQCVMPNPWKYGTKTHVKQVRFVIRGMFLKKSGLISFEAFYTI